MSATNWRRLTVSILNETRIFFFTGTISQLGEIALVMRCMQAVGWHGYRDGDGTERSEISCRGLKTENA